MPIQRRPNFCAAATAVPQPQKGSSTISSLRACRDDAFEKCLRLLGVVAETLLRTTVDAGMSSQRFWSGTSAISSRKRLNCGTVPGCVWMIRPSSMSSCIRSREYRQWRETPITS